MVHRAWSQGFSVQSDFARTNATAIAAAAYCGYITTKTDAATFGSWWRVTGLGMAFMDTIEQGNTDGL